jgi:hypothetical protein
MSHESREGPDWGLRAHSISITLPTKCVSHASSLSKLCHAEPAFGNVRICHRDVMLRATTGITIVWFEWYLDSEHSAVINWSLCINKCSGRFFVPGRVWALSLVFRRHLYPVQLSGLRVRALRWVGSL